VGRGSLERALLSFTILLAVAGGVVAVNRARHSHVNANDPVVEYLNALVRHDYVGAYKRTDLSADRIPASSSAITRAHFEAFERARPLKSWRRVGNAAELAYQSGSRVRVNLAINDDGVHVPVSLLSITARGGPLPSLAVDNVPVPIVPLPGLGTRAVGGFRYRYGLVVISGRHRFDVGAGPVTAAQDLTRTVRASGRTVDSMTVVLSLSARGDQAVATALRDRKSVV